MRIVRFTDGEGVKYGVLEENIVRGIKGSPFEQFTAAGCLFELDGSTYKLDEVKLLAPCTPSKIVCVGGNHITHPPLEGTGTKAPLIFIKPSTTVIGPDDTVIIPENNIRVTLEGELAAVIGKKAKNVPEDKIKEYVLGYTCHNDIGDLAYIEEDGGCHTRSKGFDTFSPIGPCIQTELDPDNVKLETHFNGELCQSDNTSGLIVSVYKIISFMSSVMTLLPGDVISTGTPEKLTADIMKPGDVVEITIENIGTLRHYVSG